MAENPEAYPNVISYACGQWRIEVNVTEFIEGMQERLRAEAAGGRTTIAIAQLDSFLTEVVTRIGGAAEPDIPAAELRDAYRQATIEWTRGNVAREIEGFKATVTAGQEALRTSLLIHGGAAAAVLALLSGLLTSKGGSEIIRATSIADSLLWFAGAVFCIGFASAFAYVTQRFYGASKITAGNVCNVVAVLFGLASYGLFVAGVYETYRAVTSAEASVYIDAAQPKEPSTPPPVKAAEEAEPEAPPTE